MKYYAKFECSQWEIVLVGDGAGLTHLHMFTGQGARRFEISDQWRRDDNFFTGVRDQLLEYFNGQRQRFDAVLNPQGTDFQKRVWNELRTIPYGELRTYKDIATAVGNPAASRAVGMANSKNPIPIIVPCHRVIGSDGELTGFAHGLDAKARLLEIEGAR